MLPKLSILILVSTIFFACQKRSALLYDKVECYTEFCESITKYSASPIARQVNWDSICAINKSRVNSELSESEYFDIIGELLLHFRDPHIWLISPERSLYSIDSLDYEKNIDLALIEESYLTTKSIHSESIISGIISDSIAYIYCQNFKGEDAEIEQIYQDAFSTFSNTKGLIIDLRDNDGGSVYNAGNLLAKLTDERTFWHTTENRIESGFDGKYEWFIEPDDNIFYDKSVVVLTGRYTISAGERFAIGASILPNLTLIGDTTSNTQGSVTGREMLNGWSYTFTFERCLAPDGTNYAGIGIPPDIFIDTTDIFSNGRDKIMDKAIEILE